MSFLRKVQKKCSQNVKYNIKSNKDVKIDVITYYTYEKPDDLEEAVEDALRLGRKYPGAQAKLVKLGAPMNASEEDWVVAVYRGDGSGKDFENELITKVLESL